MQKDPEGTRVLYIISKSQEGKMINGIVVSARGGQEQQREGRR